MDSNQSQLLDAGLRLFSQRGYDAVGVQEIVDAIGIQKPTLYHYFGSKKGLLEEIFKSNFASFVDLLKAKAQYKRDLQLNLQNILELYLSFASNHPDFYRLQLSAWTAPIESEVYRTALPNREVQHTILSELFRLAAADHGNMKSRHDAYAASFLGLINTYALLLINGLIPYTPDLAFKILHQFMHGIFS